MSHLKLGILTRHDENPSSLRGDNKPNFRFSDTQISRWIERKEAISLYIPVFYSDAAPEQQIKVAAYAEEIDALILDGCVDPHPEFDRFQLKIIEALISLKKPILGISYGFHLINMYFLGSSGRDGQNKCRDELQDKNIKFIQNNPEGILSEVCSPEGLVSSVPNGKIVSLGKSLVVEAISDYGIEAFSMTDDQFILGINWYPYVEFENNKNFLNNNELLDLFCEATRRRKYFGSVSLKKRKHVKFGESEALTIGAELELQLLNPKTYDLEPAAIGILSELKNQTSRVKSEIFQSMIEIETGICINAHDIERDLQEALNILLPIATKKGALICGSGTHPFARYIERKLTPGSRYKKLIEKNQWIARRIAIFGLHIHLGMENPSQAMKCYQLFLSLSPLFLGISASSSFWESEQTGLASVRSTFFECTPAGGHPPILQSWDQFEGLYNKMISSGTITTHKDLWWDLRPSPNYGTIELRICDTMPTILENTSLVALIHLVGLAFLKPMKPQIKWPELSEWSYRENKWRAIRHGLDFDFIIEDNGKTMRAVEYLEYLIDSLRYEIKNLQYDKYIKVIRDILKSGPPTVRQNMVYRKTNSLKEVVKHCNEELLKNHPIW